MQRRVVCFSTHAQNTTCCVATAHNIVMPLPNPILHHTCRQRWFPSPSPHAHIHTNMHTPQPPTHKLLPHIITICTDKGTHLDGDETRGQLTCLHNMSYTNICMYMCVHTVDSINTQLTSLQPHTPFHLDMTLPHSTAVSEVPLQLAEVLGEASQLAGLGSPLSSAFLASAGEGAVESWHRWNLPPSYSVLSGSEQSPGTPHSLAGKTT